MSVLPKLDMILENKVVHKLKFKYNLYKNWLSKLIFIYDFFLIMSIFGMEYQL